MSALTTWWDAVSVSWSDLWTRIANFIPNIIGAVLILVIGWLVAIILAKIVDQILRWVQLPLVFKEAKVEDLVKRVTKKYDTVGLLAAFVKWVLMIVVFIAALQVLNLQAVSDFLTKVLDYTPSVIGGGAILLIGLVLANFLGTLVEGSLEALELSHAGWIGVVTRWSIYIFTFLAVLVQLGVAVALITTLFTGFVVAVAIALGLSFGLGGQGVAKELLEKIKKDVQR